MEVGPAIDPISAAEQKAALEPKVELNEVLARQIKDGAGGPIFYYDSDRNPPLAPEVFRPNKNDGNGLSMIRLRYREEWWAAHRPSIPETRFRLARIEAKDLAEIGRESGIDDFPFGFSPDDLDSIHGPPHAHVLLSAINWHSYSSDDDAKMRIKTWQRKLAEFIHPNEITPLFDPPRLGIHRYRPDERSSHA
jgi:hypothetical protein